MARIPCSQCGRTMPPDTIRADGAFCPYCGRQQGMGKRSLEQVSPKTGSADMPAPPTEEVSFSLRESMGRCVGSVIVTNTLLGSMIGGTAGLLFLSFALAGQFPVIVASLGAAAFFAMMWALGSILTIPFMLYFTLYVRSRRIEAEGTLLHLQIGRKRKTVDLAEHAWQRCGKVATDFYGSYFWTRPRLKVVSEKAEFAFAFDEESEAKWIEYLYALGIEEKARVQWRRFLVNSMLVSFVGGAVGTLLEPLFAIPNGRQGSVIFTGFLDGLLSAMFYQWDDARRKLGSSRIVCTATMALLFMGIGMKAGGLSGWQVYSANAVLGAVIGWFVWQDEGQR